MLRISKIRPPRARYYLTTTRAGGGSEEGLIEPDGRFAGSLGDELEIGGEVIDSAALRALFGGVDPKTGTVLDARHRRVSIAAFDCMFASPKSVSVLHALGTEEVVAAVRDAHERAVVGALGYLERNASYVRRDGSLSKSVGFVAAGFVHRTSRASDPHLHTHLLVTNLSVDRNGRWSAIDARPLFANVGAAGSLYRAQLRNEITMSVGVEWKSRAEGFADLIGISPRALRAFSSRAKAIEQELESSGHSGERAEQVAAERTRPEKDTSTPYSVLVERWRERAYELGVSRSALDGLGRRQSLGREPLHRTPDVAAEVARSAARFERPFDRRELIRAACARLDAGAETTTVEAAVDSVIGSGELVSSGKSSVRLRGLGASRFPAGITEERFVNRETAHLAHRLTTALARAPELSITARSSNDGVGDFGTYTIAASEPPYEALQRLAVEANSRGRVVVGLSPNLITSAHLEATTGIEPAAWNEMARVRNGAFIVLANALRCPLRPTVELLAEAEARRMTVVVLDDLNVRRRADESFIATRIPNTSLERFSTLGVRVTLASDFTSAVAEVRRLSDDARANGQHALTVSADTRLFGDEDRRVIHPSGLSRALVDVPDAEMIVFGSARLLGSAINRISDAKRTHVSVLPTRTEESLRSHALEVGEPCLVRELLGRLPASPHARTAWRSRAKTIERRFELSGRERVPERVRNVQTGLVLERGRALV